MRSRLYILFSIVVLCVLIARATASPDPDPDTIHPFAYGTTISYTTPPGQKIGCLTSGTSHTLKVDFYYTDTSDLDQRITSLALETGDGTNEGSYVPVAFSVTWEYSIDGEITWHSYSGTGDIDVPYSGRTNIGNLLTTDPHATVKLTFPVSGSLGQVFYYRIHFTSYKYGPQRSGNAGNHYFWYDICAAPVPEFSFATPLATSIGMILLIAAQKILKKKRD